MPTGTHLRFTMWFDAGVSFVGGTPWASWHNYFDYLADDAVDYDAAAAVLWSHLVPPMMAYCLLHTSVREATVHNPEVSIVGPDTILYAPGREFGTLLGEGENDRQEISEAVIVQRTHTRSVPSGRGRIFLPPTHRDVIADKDSGLVNQDYPPLVDLIEAVQAVVTVGSIDMHPALWSGSSSTLTPVNQVFASRYTGRRVVRRPIF